MSIATTQRHYVSRRDFDYEKIMVDKEELKKVCGGSRFNLPSNIY